MFNILADSSHSLYEVVSSSLLIVVWCVVQQDSIMSSKWHKQLGLEIVYIFHKPKDTLNDLQTLSI